MKKSASAIIILFFVTAYGYAQEIQKEINTQVWIPFVEGFSTRNTELFMSVHSKDLIRAPRDSKSLANYDLYKKQNEEGNKHSTSELSIELRFQQRIASENQAFEVGVYKTSYTNSKGDTQASYGRFHVALRKENGSWKILVDSDSSENGAIGEKDFSGRQANVAQAL